MTRNLLLLSFVLLLFISCTDSEINYINQSDNSQRYNSQIFATLTVTKDIRYGANVTLGGATQGLTMDIYEPENDTETNRPLIVLAHGGSFISGNKADMEPIATFLAKAGYVVASINYRLIDVIPSQLTFKQAAVNAVADMKAAVRYFHKDIATDNKYKINANTIFVGGYSAGAITALHYAYLKTDSELATIGGTSFVNYVNSNGGIEGKSGNESYPSTIKGVINISGSLFDKNFINANEPVLYSIHGTADAVVPYLNGNTSSTGILTDGSGLLHPQATAVGVYSELKTITDGKHDAYLKCNSCEVEIRNFLYSQLSK